MTKKRIGTIYGSPIVEGDKNLKTSNEIHVSELGGGNSGSEKYLYFKWEGDTPPETLMDVCNNFVTFNVSYLFSNIYSSSFNKPVTTVINIYALGSGISPDAQFKGISIMNMLINLPGEGSYTTEEYFKMGLQNGDLPFQEAFEFLFTHKVSEEEFFKGVEVYTP